MCVCVCVWVCVCGWAEKQLTKPTTSWPLLSGVCEDETGIPRCACLRFIAFTIQRGDNRLFGVGKLVVDQVSLNDCISLRTWRNVCVTL